MRSLFFSQKKASIHPVKKKENMIFGGRDNLVALLDLLLCLLQIWTMPELPYGSSRAFLGSTWGMIWGVKYLLRQWAWIPRVACQIGSQPQNQVNSPPEITGRLQHIILGWVLNMEDAQVTIV